MKSRLITLILTAGFPLVSLADDALEQCRQRVMDYAYYWDQSDAQGLAQVFTEDATLTLGGKTFSGREAIVERMLAGKDGPILRHLVTTVKISATAEGTATGVSYVTVYAAERVDEGLPSVAGFALIGEYHDTYRLMPDGCRIAERELHPVMRQQGS
jgi:uncharacterized protein (TIGR02246 family)